jgi:hypothetical protein
MNKDSDTATIVLGCLALIFLVPIMTIALYILNGWVLSQLWQWFVVTTFNLRPLSIPEAIGIAMVVGFLTHEYNDSKKEEHKGWAVVVPLLMAFVGPLITLLAGYILYSSYFVH